VAKVSEEKVAEHRAALVGTAKRLLQERGFDGAGVADISREAGLTQGALYGQFGSKDALCAEAMRKAFADGAATWAELCDNECDPLRAYLDGYLCEAHLEDAGSGCPLAACVSEITRQDPAIGTAFAEGFQTLVCFMQNALPDGMPTEAARRRALTLVAAIVGSIAIARAVRVTDPAVAKEVIAAARHELETFALSSCPRGSRGAEAELRSRSKRTRLRVAPHR
jgi:TetR/AcrR family transcriptional regulator, transcriptional repressor for nem operon